jgi:hypothetical protein
MKVLNNIYCLLGSIIEEIAFRNGHFLLHISEDNLSNYAPKMLLSLKINPK